VTPGALAQAGCDADVVLRDGSTAHVRPASAADRWLLLDFYAQLSPESRYFRFFGKPRVENVVDDVVRACSRDDALTLVAEFDHRLVAVGQFFRSSEKPERAEVAFAIADAHQGRGIGTKLLERLAIAARACDITTFEAYLLRSNQKMREVFVDSGLPQTWDTDNRIAHVVLSLRPAASPRSIP
jgi:GNAT superfamily N-acetyltransferase